ncbi:hypothetical protein [Bartonella sp. LJL80]
MTSLAHVQDDRFREPGIATPLTFLIMFIFFIYGALLVGLLGVSDWIIHAWNLTFFLNLGGFGVFLLALIIPALWAVLVAICATVPYVILRARGRFILASKVATIIVFAMFHIFALPWILWPMIRRGSPKMRQNHIRKLRQMVKAGKMDDRLAERRQRLIDKGYQF